MKKNALSSLIPSESKQPWIVNDLGASLGPLTTLPFLQSLKALLQFWPGEVQAHLPQVRDEASSIEVSPADAKKLFENGMGLMFDHAHKYSPMLTQWLESLREDLGLSALTFARCLIYATAAGKGTAPHFDQNLNFVLQIHGTKKWWLAPNAHVENPLTRHTMGLEVDPELASYSQLPLPLEMPADSQLFILKPGSLLFVPRGTWHCTEAESDALSLNFTYSAPSWLDLFSAALRSRLALSSEWRATAEDVSHSDKARREMATEKFDELLFQLTQDLPNWKASEILEVTEAKG